MKLRSGWMFAVLPALYLFAAACSGSVSTSGTGGAGGTQKTPTVDRIQESQAGQCFPHTIPADTDGRVDCFVVEGRKSEAGACACDAKARSAVSKEHQAIVTAAQADAVTKQEGLDCFCEIPQAEPPGLAPCQNDTGVPLDANGQLVSGWCWIDSSVSPPVGNSDITSPCPEGQKHIVRFVGNANPVPGAELFIGCYAP